MGLFKRIKSRQEKLAEVEDGRNDVVDSSKDNSSKDNSSDDILTTLADMPITEHLIELRRHLIKICVAILVIFLGLVGFAGDLYNFISEPLIGQLPDNGHIIATDPISGFMTPIRLTLFVAAFIAMPYILYQVWSFVAPGLYKKEKKIAIPLLLLSVVLFYTGVAFAYYAVLKNVLKFLILFTPENVVQMPDIESYLGLALKLLMVFGLTFEIPVITFLLILVGIVSIESLQDKRRYIVVGCFGVAAVVTPPDGVSMLLLAIPMWLLFELGLLLAKILIKDKKEDKADHIA